MAKLTQWNIGIESHGNESFEHVAVIMEIYGEEFKNMGPVIKRAARVYLREVEQAFATKTSPDGQAWAELAEKTQKDRERLQQGSGSDPRLIRSGTLHQAATQSFERIGYTAGPNTTFATIEVNAQSDNGYNYAYGMQYGSFKYPARPFLPSEFRMEAVLTKIGRQYVDEILDLPSVGNITGPYGGYTAYSDIYGF